MTYQFQPIWATKKTIVLRNGREIRTQLYERRTVTKTGRIKFSVECIKYKGLIYKVERIRNTYKYRQKNKL